MNEKDRKQILLCVVGKTPQIITGTLYALVRQRGETVDEIRVITTMEGRNAILAMLLQPGVGKFFGFCRHYGLDANGIRFDETCIALLHTSDGRLFEDIRSVEDNERAADQICEVVRELTRDPGTCIHASAAGGRKTMSIYLTIAMQLYGRVQDRLSHVLVSEEFEMHPDFFYTPPVAQELEIRDRHGNLIKQISTDQAQIHLADIPFIRLRSIMSHYLLGGTRSYNELVRQMQEELDLVDSAHDLLIDCRKNTVMVAGRAVKMTLRELFIYLLLVRFNQNRVAGNGFVSLEQISWDDLDATFRQMSGRRGPERGLSEHELMPRCAFIAPLAQEVASQNPKDRENFKTSFGEIIAKIKRKFEAESLPDQYFIIARGLRGHLRYGIALAPERIRVL